MIGYVIAFFVALGLVFIVMYDSLFVKKKIKHEISDKNSHEQKEKHEYAALTAYLRNHVYKNQSFNFQQLKDSKNGYYYENNNFSLTLFEYPTYRTAQFFQVKPYQQLAVMRVNKQSLQEMEVEYKNVSEECRTLVYLFFEKVREINVKMIHQTRTDAEIQDIMTNIQLNIVKMEKEKQLLSLELKHTIRRIQSVELPEITQRYHSLPPYELETGKTRIKQSLEEILNNLQEKWSNHLEEKKKEYEQLMTLSEKS